MGDRLPAAMDVMAAGTRRHGLTRDELNELLEAFAADTLTREQQSRLTEAARRDERLLSALADAEELRAVVQDPVLRTRLLLELQEGSEASAGAYWWTRSWVWLTAGGAAIAAALIIGLLLSREPASDPLLSRHSQDAPPASDPLPEPTPPAVQPLEAPGRPAPAPDPPPAEVSKKNETAEPVERGEPMTRRAPTPFGPVVEERVVDDEVKAAAVTRPGSPARSKTGRSREGERAPVAAPMKEEPATPPLPAEPLASPEPQVSRPAEPVPAHQPEQVRGARALFYGDESLATPAALSSDGGQAPALQTEQQTVASSAHNEPAPLAVRYSLIIATPEGTDQEVDPKTPVSLSDRPRLAVQTNQEGYLLVTDLPSASDMAIAPTAIKSVQARTPILFPLAGLMTASEPTLRMRIGFSRRRPDPAQLLSQTPGPLLEERVARSEPTEFAVYAAVPSASGAPMLLVELALNQGLQAVPSDVALPRSEEIPVP